MITRTRLDQKGSLNAIWHEYLSARVLLSNTENATIPHTSVVQALLNSRFYDSQRGQFLSEDPVFWEVGQTQDGNAALTNPQAMNSYGYGNGNPITNSDPNRSYSRAGGIGLAGVAQEVGLA
jgi:RHS repeat-associated protein